MVEGIYSLKNIETVFKGKEGYIYEGDIEEA